MTFAMAVRGIVASVLLAGLVAGSDGTLAKEPTAVLQIENIIAVPDAERTVRKIVSAAEGALLVATGADGTVYTLTIPASALIWDEEISLTPWMLAQGFGNAPIIGFDVGPSGIELLIPATMIIEPKDNAFVGKKRKDVKFFETQGTGQVEARIAFPADDQAFGLRLFHFSGGGVFEGAEAVRTFFHTDQSGVTPDFVSREARARVPTEQIIETIKDWQRQIVQDRDAGRIDGIKAEGQLATTQRLMDEAAGVLLDKKLAALEQARKDEETKSKIAEIDANAIAARGDASEYEDLIDALRLPLEVERQKQLLGLTDDNDKAASAEFNGKIIGVIEKFLDAAAKNCAEHPAAVPVILGIARNSQLVGAYEGIVEKSLDVLSNCRPKKSLQQAIDWCYQTGDYQTLLNVYSILLRSPQPTGRGFDEKLGTFVPPTIREGMRLQVMAALNGCLKYEVSIKVKSHYQSTHVYDTNPSVHSFLWSWKGKAALKNAGEFDEGGGYNPDPFIQGSVVGEVENCNCVLDHPGKGMQSCVMKTCTPRNDRPEEERWVYLKRLRFVGDQLRRLEIGGSANVTLYATTCDEGPCGETGGDFFPLVSCQRAVDVKVQNSSTVGLWFGTGKCRLAISDLQWQSDSFEFEIRHTGKSP